MEPKFQTSFIPKTPIGSSSKNVQIAIHSGSIFSSFAKTIFILTLVISIGVYAYDYYLAGQIEVAQKEVTTAKQAYQPDAIRNILDASTRINSAKKILDNHIAVSQFFEELQKITLKRVSFTDLKFGMVNNAYSVSMRTEAQSYNALAKQLEVFKANQYFKNPQFGGIELLDSGYIGATFNSTLDSKLVSFKSFLDEELE